MISKLNSEKLMKKLQKFKKWTSIGYLLMNYAIVSAQI